MRSDAGPSSTNGATGGEVGGQVRQRACRPPTRNLSYVDDTTGHDYLVTGFLSKLAVVLTAQDRPVEAVAAAQEAVELAQRRGWGATPRMAVT